DLARVGQRLLHGRASDLVEGDAEGPVVVELEFVFQVPGDRLALAVGVGGQVNVAGLVRFALDLGKDFFCRPPFKRGSGTAALLVVLVLDDVGRDPALEIHAGNDFAGAAAAGQVADMTIAGQHPII